jgi:hypothetical protein
MQNLIRVSLIVNGREFATFSVNDRLMQGHPSWTGLFKTFPPEEQFARGLRVNLGRQNSSFDEEIARLTGIFKDLNVSGWQNGPIQTARVVGKLQSPPSDSKDGFATLDLELERVEARGAMFVLDGAHGVRHKRYLRIEYKHRTSNGSDDSRFKSWHPGDRLAVSGQVLWDTDRNGFYEIHPDSSSQVKVLSPADDGASSTVGLWWDKLWSK